MNIFLLDKNLKRNAMYHVDKHVVKMPLELTQMLCTAVHLTDTPVKVKTYKPTHVKHPCTKWVMQSLAHWKWTRLLTLALGDEYTYRYGKVHKSVIVAKDLPEPNIKEKHWLSWPPECMALEYKLDNVINSYRNYYMKAKANIATWKGRDKPFWFNV